jgi:CRP-like cAMP-binding protein/Pyruvate/2-oxoacid:ferredoxin oxidoreductase delta subunit
MVVPDETALSTGDLSTAPTALPAEAIVLSIDQVIELDLFADCREVMRTELKRRYQKEYRSAWFLGVAWDKQPAAWLRKFKKGDVICREGEFDQTGFYILRGRVKVFIAAQRGHLRSKERKGKGLFSLFNRFMTGLVSSSPEPPEEANQRQTIPTDSPVDLDLQNPVAELKSGDLFGEMTCINNYPRSATVVALEDCECLELLAPVLRLLKSKSSRFKDDYRNRALLTHLSNVPAFSENVEWIHSYLKDRIEFIDLSPLDKKGNDVIFREGDEPDGFYLIRNGHVKVSKTVPGGEVVLGYIGRGDYFGETGLLEGIPRTATCEALDTVELVRINPEDFRVLVDRFETVREHLMQKSTKRMIATEMLIERQSAYHLDDFLSKGLMDAQNLLLLDLEKCTRCDECVRACSDSHDGITRLNRVGERFDKFLVATSCRSCTDPLCMTECPVGSIRRRENLEIVIESWCIGCTKCAQHCPYGNINMQEIKELDPLSEIMGSGKKAFTPQKAVTCDLCSGISGGPRCVYACPHDAAHRVKREEFPDYFPSVFAEDPVPVRKDSGNKG